MTPVVGALVARRGLLAVVAAVALALRSRLLVVAVVGDSMRPTLVDGDRLLVLRRRTVRRGGLVVFRPPREIQPGDPPLLVKRVAAAPGDPTPAWLPGTRAGRTLARDEIAVLGDAAVSEDSRQWGALPRSSVVGHVLGGPRRRS